MIRECRESDWPAVCEMVAQDRPSLSDRLILSRLSANSVVFEVGGLIQGVAARTAKRVSPTGTKVSAWVYTAPLFRHRGIGGALWRRLWPHIVADPPQFIATSYRSDTGDASEFFARRGFRHLVSSDCLGYRGKAIDYVPVLKAEPYTEQHFWDFISLANEAFLQLRRDNGILPHLCYPPGFDEVVARHRLMLFREGVFIFRNLAGDTVGYVWIEGPAIDAIAVAPGFTGQGYGSEIMKYAINFILKRGHSTVTLEVAQSNQRAKRLYNAMGFTLLETVDEARMYDVASVTLPLK